VVVRELQACPVWAWAGCLGICCGTYVDTRLGRHFE
jgi:hypothetical protein